MAKSSPVVETCLGKLQGKIVPGCEESDRDVFGFYGIPFAEPPLGELRFEPPQKPEPWSEIFEATTMPPSPMQDSTSLRKAAEYSPFWNLNFAALDNISEDCLYLNVFTPKLCRKAHLPVLFSIHGGFFKVGGCVHYNGDVLCNFHDIVVVVPNYRTNVFGFFETGRETSWSGNIGMKDQVAALEWTRDNIEAFGGNPNNVTIYGESGGSTSVCLHLLSPMSRGLFHRAIAQSGTTEIPGAFEDDKSAKRKEFLEALKITDEDAGTIVKKLKLVPAEELLRVQSEVMPDLLWLTIDGTFLPDHPRKLLMTQGFAPVPFMLGFNNTEGYGVLAGNYPPQFADGLDEGLGLMILKNILTIPIMADKVDDVVKLLTSAYLKLYSDEDKYRWSKVIGDVMDGFIGAAMVGYAMTHSAAGNPTYLCYMTQQLLCNHDSNYSGNLKMKPAFCQADHADDLIFTFGLPLSPMTSQSKFKFSDDEVELSKSWMRYISQFAATGNPNCGSGVEWPGFDPQHRKFLEMRTPLREGANLYMDRLQVWLEKIPALFV